METKVHNNTKNLTGIHETNNPEKTAYKTNFLLLPKLPKEKWLKVLSFSYRDLFLSDQKAVDKENDCIDDCPNIDNPDSGGIKMGKRYRV